MIKIAYWIIGLTLIIWLNIVSFIYGGEAAILPLILIILIGMPSSLAAYIIIAFVLSKTPMDFAGASFIVTNLVILSAVYAGYLQWFHFIARVISNEGNNEDVMRNMRNINAGKIKNESNN